MTSAGAVRGWARPGSSADLQFGWGRSHWVCGLAPRFGTSRFPWSRSRTSSGTGRASLSEDRKAEAAPIDEQRRPFVVRRAGPSAVSATPQPDDPVEVPHTCARSTRRWSMPSGRRSSRCSLAGRAGGLNRPVLPSGTQPRTQTGQRLCLAEVLGLLATNL